MVILLFFTILLNTLSASSYTPPRNRGSQATAPTVTASDGSSTERDDVSQIYSPKVSSTAALAELDTLFAELPVVEQKRAAITAPATIPTSRPSLIQPRMQQPAGLLKRAESGFAAAARAAGTVEGLVKTIQNPSGIIAAVKGGVTNILSVVLLRTGQKSWKHIRPLVENAIGLEKIYEVDAAGTPVLDKTGQRIPKLYATDENGNKLIDEDGMPVENTWLKSLDTFEHGSRFLYSAASQVYMKAILDAGERMVVRPALAHVFGIPYERLSYAYYLASVLQQQERINLFRPESVFGIRGVNEQGFISKKLNGEQRTQLNTLAAQLSLLKQMAEIYAPLEAYLKTQYPQNQKWFDTIFSGVRAVGGPIVKFLLTPGIVAKEAAVLSARIAKFFTWDTVTGIKKLIKAPTGKEIEQITAEIKGIEEKLNAYANMFAALVRSQKETPNKSDGTLESILAQQKSTDGDGERAADDADAASNSADKASPNTGTGAGTPAIAGSGAAAATATTALANTDSGVELHTSRKDHNLSEDKQLIILLVTAQERLLKEVYGERIIQYMQAHGRKIPTYEQYLGEIILPAILVKVTPDRLIDECAKKLGLPYDTSLNAQKLLAQKRVIVFQALKKLDLISRLGSGFQAAYYLTRCISAFKQVHEAPKLAGNYVKLFDAIDLLAQFMSKAAKAADLTPINVKGTLSHGLRKKLYAIAPARIAAHAGPRYNFGFSDWELIEKAANKAGMSGDTLHGSVQRNVISKAFKTTAGDTLAPALEKLKTEHATLLERIEAIKNNPAYTLTDQEKTEFAKVMQKLAEAQATANASGLDAAKKAAQTTLTRNDLLVTANTHIQANAALQYERVAGMPLEETSAADGSRRPESAPANPFYKEVKAPTTNPGAVGILTESLKLMSGIAEFYTNIYQDWGLREVLLGIDEACLDGVEMNLSVLTRIAKERMVGHAIGFGARKLFGAALPLLLQKLQGDSLTQQLVGKLVQEKISIPTEEHIYRIASTGTRALLFKDKKARAQATALVKPYLGPLGGMAMMMNGENMLMGGMPGMEGMMPGMIPGMEGEMGGGFGDLFGADEEDASESVGITASEHPAAAAGKAAQRGAQRAGELSSPRASHQQRQPLNGGAKNPQEEQARQALLTQLAPLFNNPQIPANLRDQLQNAPYHELQQFVFMLSQGM